MQFVTNYKRSVMSSTIGKLNTFELKVTCNMELKETNQKLINFSPCSPVCCLDGSSKLNVEANL